MPNTAKAITETRNIVLACRVLPRIISAACLQRKEIGVNIVEKGGEYMVIHKSAEDYLETMLILHQRHGYIRSIDIAEELGVKKPSVTYITKRLRENGYITMDDNSLITLTNTGLEIAERIYERHITLIDCLMRLGVSEKAAREDACKLEHDLSDETFNAICKFVRKEVF